jgi:putative acetyltransferase
MTPLIRPEAPGDRLAVYEVNLRAFGRTAEAKLVEALRALELPILSLVAEVEGGVVGHVLFSPVTIAKVHPEDSRLRSDAVALGPLAVHPEWQGRGVGGALVRAGLGACRQQGETRVVLLGHPDYYPRFGFRPAADYGIHYRSREYDHALFALELKPGALEGVSGWLSYLPPFEAL